MTKKECENKSNEINLFSLLKKNVDENKFQRMKNVLSPLIAFDYVFVEFD